MKGKARQCCLLSPVRIYIYMEKALSEKYLNMFINIVKEVEECIYKN
jgi:hypothetical protein